MVASAWSWGRRGRLAADALRVSGVIGGIAMVFLVGMYAAFAAGQQSTGMRLGFINDVGGIVTLPLAFPAMLVLHDRLRAEGGRANDGLLIVGLGASGAISILQILLVARVLPFEQQIGPVTIAFLVLAVYFVLIGRIATRAGLISNGPLLGLGAGLYFGYPLWAFRFAKVVEGTTRSIAEAAAG